MTTPQCRLWTMLSGLVVASTTIFFVISYTQSPNVGSRSSQAVGRELLSSKDQVYYDRELFEQGYKQMLKELKVYVYQDAFDARAAFANVFVPHPDPLNPKLGNYFSEHMFKINLVNSSFLTKDPEEATFFFMPFSVNVMRYDSRIRTNFNIAQFVAKYVDQVSMRLKYWNRTDGADHFYAMCHSVGRDAASGSPVLQRNAIQVTCSANYYQRLYVPHKDIAMPQVWPRLNLQEIINPAHLRNKLAFFSGRSQNSLVRQLLRKFWGNDSDIRIDDGVVRGSYEEAFRTSKFCLHVKGYEVNTARISDAIHFGCVPVIISDQYDLPFGDVLRWSSFSVIVPTADIPSLKDMLLAISDEQYNGLHSSVLRVRKHFSWHSPAQAYDSFHMTMYELWNKRHVLRP